MRSRKNEYIIAKNDVDAFAIQWLAAPIWLEYAGRRCTTDVLLQIVLIARSTIVSAFAVCRGFADAPTSVAICHALYATLPEARELQRGLNLALVAKVPPALKRKARAVAVDLTLIPAVNYSQGTLQLK